MRFAYRLIFSAALIGCPWTSLKAEGQHGHHHHEQMQNAAPELSGGSLFNLKSEWLKIDGSKTTVHSLAGHPRLVAMLYTSCTTACPMIVEDMKSIRARLPAKKQDRLKLTVLSFDSDRDKPEALRAFAKKRNLNLQFWDLLSPAKQASANEIAAALGVKFKKVKNDYIHSNAVFLLNERGEIVATKDGLATKSDDFEAKISSLLD